MTIYLSIYACCSSIVHVDDSCRAAAPAAAIRSLPLEVPELEALEVRVVLLGVTVC